MDKEFCASDTSVNRPTTSCCLVGEEDNVTLAIGHDATTVDSLAALELGCLPNSIQVTSIEGIKSLVEDEDDVDVLIPSSSVYMRSPMMLHAVKTKQLEPDSAHPGRYCKPFIVDLQEDAVSNKRSCQSSISKKTSAHTVGH